MAGQGSLAYGTVALNVVRQAPTAFSFGRHSWWHSKANGLVASAASRYVVILDPSQSCYVATLSGHTDSVHGVCWIPVLSRSSAHATTEGASLRASGASIDVESGRPCFGDETELLSCSADKTLRAWKIFHDSTGDCIRWECTATLRGHTGSITSVAVLLLADGAVVAGSTSADCTVRLWYRAPDSIEWTMVASHAVKPASVMESIALSVLPGWSQSPSASAGHAVDLSSYGIIIATGGADAKVHLYSLHAEQPASNQSHHSLKTLLVCPGHSDWIRSLSFSYDTQLSSLFGSSAVVGGHFLMLASASQDGKIRLWRITGQQQQQHAVPEQSTNNADDAATEDEEDGEGNEAAASNSAAAQATEGGGVVGTLSATVSASEFQRMLLMADDPTQTSLRRPSSFTVDNGSSSASYEILFDALLSGHSGATPWVHCVRWHPPVAVTAGCAGDGWRLWQPPCVYSASSDKSIILWQPIGASSSNDAPAAQPSTLSIDQKASSVWEGVWEPASRMGAAGAASTGMYGCSLSPDARTLVAHGFQGALHVWRSTSAATAPSAPGMQHHMRVISRFSDFDLSAPTAPRGWKPVSTPGGHFGSVADICWGTNGQYLLSAGSDSTTRVWAPALIGSDDVHARGGILSSRGSGAGHFRTRWYEVGRPQIHGYELISIAMPRIPGLPHRLYSGADEKVIRVFDAPQLFLSMLRSMSEPALLAAGYGPVVTDAPSDHQQGQAHDGQSSPQSRPSIQRAAFAYLPELALTNKAVQDERAAAAIRDRFQLDGRDAIQNKQAAEAAEIQEASKKAFASDGDGDSETVGNRPATDNAGDLNAAAQVPYHVSAPSDRPVISIAAQNPSVAASSSSTAPPLEEDLVQHTRWPEADKLYGHLNEVVCLASDSSGYLIASACKGRNEEAASIWIWDSVTGRPKQQLKAHKLTAERLEFSPAIECVRRLEAPAAGLNSVEGIHCVRDTASASAATGVSELLVSVGRDRQIAVFGATTSTAATGNTIALPKYSLLKAFYGHKRQIWSAAVAPVPDTGSVFSASSVVGAGLSTGMRLFATGARDQIVKFWTVSRRNQQEVAAEIATSNAAAAAAAASAPAKAPIRARGILGAASAGPAGDDDEGAAGAGSGGADGLGAASSVIIDSVPAGEDGSAMVLSSAFALPAFDCGATALAFAPISRSRTDASTAGSRVLTVKSLLAVGLESGAIHIFAVSGSRPAADSHAKWAWSHEKVASFDAAHGHVSAVRRIAWRPLPLDAHGSGWAAIRTGSADDGSAGTEVQCRLELATASNDHAVRFSALNVSL